MEHPIITARCKAIFDKFFSPSVHAYMLCADKHAGKGDIAAYAAKRFLCSGSVAPCESCPSCVMLSSSREHPCLTVLSRAKGKATIPVDDIRSIKKGIFDAPFLSPYKIFIIEEAESMSPGAQNALLKILEEPPQHAIFILTVSKRQAILPTISSRCRVISVPPIPVSDMEVIVRDTYKDMPYEKVRLLARLSSGLPNRLEALMEKDYASTRSLAISTFREVAFGDGMKTIYRLTNDTFAKGQREAASEFLYVISSLVNDAAGFSILKSATQAVNCDETELIEAIAKAFPLKKLLNYVILLQDCIKKLQSNVNVPLIIQTALLSWWDGD